MRKFRPLPEPIRLQDLLNTARSRTEKKKKYALLTKREVKMAGYWPSSSFAFLWTETKSRSIKTQKKNEANIQPLDRKSLVNKGSLACECNYRETTSPFPLCFLGTWSSCKRLPLTLSRFDNVISPIWRSAKNAIAHMALNINNSYWKTKNI